MLTLTEKNVHTGTLILVNEHHGIQGEPEDFLVPAWDGIPDILLQRCAATMLNELMLEIQGWKSIVPVSGYRPLEEQQHIWDDSFRENGPEFTRKYVAVPGHSEHQTGLAIDLGLRQENIDFIRPDFPCTGICQVFREKAAKYGFILRYPSGKENITGIGHEPWHFRYVGAPHAEIMEKGKLTLEEYIEFIRKFPYGHNSYLIQNDFHEIRISYLAATQAADGKLSMEFSKGVPFTISGNNIDGFIVTEWKIRKTQNQRSTQSYE